MLGKNIIRNVVFHVNFDWYFFFFFFPSSPFGPLFLPTHSSLATAVCTFSFTAEGLRKFAFCEKD